MEVWILWVCVSFINATGTGCASAIKSEMTRQECYDSIARIQVKSTAMIPVAMCYKKEK